MKLTKKCPECGGTEIYITKTRGAGGTGGINFLPSIGGLMGAPQLEVYVCGNCGYHQMFVPSLLLKEVKDKYKPLK